MALSFGKRDVAKMAAVLDPEYVGQVTEVRSLKRELKAAEPDKQEDLARRLAEYEELVAQVEEFAAAALDQAMQIIEDKAKFTVVGQVKKSDRKGDKIALGWYATEGQALTEAMSLTYSTQTHEEHLAWVLPVFHGTPNSYYQARKARRKAQTAADSSFREQELQRRIKWCADHPGQAPPKEWGAIPADRELTECPMCSGVGQLRIDPT